MDTPLRKIWNEQQTAPFPYAVRSLRVEDLTLLQLDAALGGLLTKCLKSDAEIRPVIDRGELKRFHGLTERALAELDLDEEATRYFERLREIAGKVLSVLTSRD